MESEIDGIKFEVLVFRWINTSKVVINDEKEIIIGDVDVAQMCRVLENSNTIYDVKNGVNGMWYDRHIIRTINLLLDGE